MPRDRITAIITFLFGIFLYVVALKIPMPDLQVGPGPAIFPKFIAILLCMLSFVMFFTSKDPKKVKGVAELASTLDNFTGQSTETKREISKLRVVLAIVIFSAYLLILPLMGFIIATAVFGVGYFLLLYKEKVPKSILHSVIITLLGFLIFQVILKVPLPTLTNGGWF